MKTNLTFLMFLEINTTVLYSSEKLLAKTFSPFHDVPPALLFFYKLFYCSQDFSNPLIQHFILHSFKVILQNVSLPRLLYYYMRSLSFVFVCLHWKILSTQCFFGILIMSKSLQHYFSRSYSQHFP